MSPQSIALEERSFTTKWAEKRDTEEVSRRRHVDYFTSLGPAVSPIARKLKA
jgi:hypothetical protein